MKVRYVYSACVVIESPDLRILCDPWFTPGAYDGSWYQWPAIDSPIDTIGPVDLIYISHIHPDHYDPDFLRHYLGRFPNARIVIGRQPPPILERKLAADGFGFEVLQHRRFGATDLWVLTNCARTVNIDTALIVRWEQQSVVNLNDNPFDPTQVAAIRALTQGSTIFALLPYGGATAHPQTFAFATEADLLEAARAKERHFLDIFHQYIDALDPHKVLPFAGQYWLGGPLRQLNKYRGIPDALTAAEEASGRGVVLADGGEAYFDLDDMTASDLRTEPYNPRAAEAYLASMAFPGYTYERELRPDPGRAWPLLSLLNAALPQARKRKLVQSTHWFCLHADGEPGVLTFDAANSEPATVSDPAILESLTPRLEIVIDPRYLFGLLSRMYHWNNALIGSHYRCKRVPDVFRRDAFDFLDYLQV
jgi:UDP-MurNAc hydroxylase